jgi:predicted transcriptional regulator
MTTPKTMLSDELQQRLEEIAREQHRQPADVLEDAVRKYLDDRSWVQMLGYGRERAEAVGITSEEGIDKAIADFRKENGYAR